jgi:hypothetical protein
VDSGQPIALFLQAEFCLYPNFSLIGAEQLRLYKKEFTVSRIRERLRSIEFAAFAPYIPHRERLLNQNCAQSPPERSIEGAVQVTITAQTSSQKIQNFLKALEIYNSTGAAIDLAAEGYVVQVSFNGGTLVQTINLTGTVADGDVFVLANPNASAAILAQANQTSSSVSFNGNDAIVLRKGGASDAVVDAIGQVGVDPGTEYGSGLTSTADNTLRRKSTVTAGDTNPSDAL